MADSETPSNLVETARKIRTLPTVVTLSRPADTSKGSFSSVLLNGAGLEWADPPEGTAIFSGVMVSVVLVVVVAFEASKAVWPDPEPPELDAPGVGVPAVQSLEDFFRLLPSPFAP